MFGPIAKQSSHCRSLFIVLAAIFAAASVSTASAQPFTQVFVFGDSNVDAGYYKAFPDPGANPTFNSLWLAAVAHGAGAPTTNPDPMKSQMLASYFGLTANPSNAGGTNYATSGAKNNVVNTAANGGFTRAIPTVTQIANYLAAHSGAADPGALYLIYSGDNDVNYANGESGTTPPADPNAWVTQAALDLAAAIQTLKNAGAGKIVVTGLAYSFPGGSGGTNPQKRALRLTYTNTLWNRLDTLGVAFVRADIDKVRSAIAAAPAKYGFTFVTNNPGEVGCSKPANVGKAFALLCSSDAAAPSTWVDVTAPKTRLFSDEEGHFGTAGQQLWARFYYSLIIAPSVTHDFGGNAKSDILWRDNTGNTAIWLMNGGAIASSAGIGQVGGTWTVTGQRDFNGDSRTDILWKDGDGNVAIWFMNGTTVTTMAGIANVGPNWNVVGTGDFDGDGKGDIMWRDSSGNVAIWLNDAPTGIGTIAGLGNPGASWSVAGITDFDGDGKADILWKDTSGNVVMWFMRGASVFSSAFVGYVGPTWNIVATGDFDGDGKADLVWRDTSGSVAVSLMNGATITTTVGLGNPGGTWTIQETGDFDGDRKSDILWKDGSGTAAIWFMNATAIASSVGIGNVGPNWQVQTANAN